MDWKERPVEIVDDYARTKVKVHNTFGGKVIETLYGAVNEEGKPVVARENAEDGHGRWYGIEVNGKTRMFSWTHSKAEGGETEYGTEYGDEALSVMESQILTKRDLCREAEAIEDNAEEKVAELREKWNALQDWDTPREAEYKVRFEKAVTANEAALAEAKKNFDLKKAVADKAEELRNAVNFKNARETLNTLREELGNIESAGEKADAAFRKQFRDIENEIREKQKAWFSQQDERRAAAKETKEKLIESAKTLTANVTNWKDAGNKLNDIFEQWRAAGSAGKDNDDQLWAEFSELRNKFFESRNEFFANQRAAWEKSAELKNALIEEAKKISGLNNYSKANTDRMKELDQEWKAAGYSGKDSNDKLFNAFKEAKEVFWSGKKAQAATRMQKTLETKEAEAENLRKTLEDLDYRLTIAPNQTMKDDIQKTMYVKKGNLEELEKEIADLKERMPE